MLSDLVTKLLQGKVQWELQSLRYSQLESGQREWRAPRKRIIPELSFHFDDIIKSWHRQCLRDRHISILDSAKIASRRRICVQHGRLHERD